MTDKELRRLTRKELLSVLISQAKEIDRLNALNEELQKKLDLREHNYPQIGSLAEASIAMNTMIEDAQGAAEMYIAEITKMRSEAQGERERILAGARKEADALLAQTKQNCDRQIEEVNAKVGKLNRQMNDYLKTHPELRDFTTGRSG